MTIMLELRPEEIAVLSKQAQAQGSDIETVLHGLVAQSAPPVPDKPELNEKQKGLIELLDAWREEDQTDDPNELDGRDQELTEFKANMNRWRAEEGRGPVYP